MTSCQYVLCIECGLQCVSHPQGAVCSVSSRAWDPMTSCQCVLSIECGLQCVCSVSHPYSAICSVSAKSYLRPYEFLTHYGWLIHKWAHESSHRWFYQWMRPCGFWMRTACAPQKHTSQNIVSFVGLFCKSDVCFKSQMIQPMNETLWVFDAWWMTSIMSSHSHYG